MKVYSKDMIFDGVKLETTADAHISDDGLTYQAPAIYQGVNVWVYWDIINATCDDQSNSCDWDKPYMIVCDYSRALMAGMGWVAQ